jgi:hypothetical protein
MMWIGFIWLRIVTSVGSCEDGKEPLGFIKGENFLSIRARISFLRTLFCGVN